MKPFNLLLAMICFAIIVQVVFWLWVIES